MGRKADVEADRHVDAVRTHGVDDLRITCICPFFPSPLPHFVVPVVAVIVLAS